VGFRKSGFVLRIARHIGRALEGRPGLTLGARAYKTAGFQGEHPLGALAMHVNYALEFERGSRRGVGCKDGRQIGVLGDRRFRSTPRLSPRATFGKNAPCIGCRPRRRTKRPGKVVRGADRRKERL